ncbi:MAG: leucyl aminopeptidase [Alphaproteobacteria bacterium]|nr:leucyl aminopeptidase [Alphaproteobacteria bacterium]
MKIRFAKTEITRDGALVVGVAEDKAFSPSAEAADRKTGGALGRAVAASRFTGGKDQALEVMAPHGLAAERVLLVGMGKAAKFDALAAEAIGALIVARLGGSGSKEASIAVEPPKGAPLSVDQAAARIANGARLGAYRFDKYRTKEKPEKKPSLKRLNVMSPDPRIADKAYDPLSKVADAVVFTRDLVSEPANILHPESLAQECKKLRDLGVEVELFGEKQMRKLGMNALLGVGQGSARESHMVVMRWEGAPKGSKEAPVAFIGKGVTFDTGGISIKPADGMESMKWDMGGAAAVIGAIHALAARKAKVDAIGVVGLVENMPSGTAQRPGDVVTSASGQTIEVINTDAEGRLVLADLLWYVQDQYKPRIMVDLATLTGAIVISLGHEHAGLFTNSDDLALKLVAAGQKENELLWRLPLSDAYDKGINSDIADMKNVGPGRAGGSITAAQFLKRFVVDDRPWAHLDIAGMAWADKDRPTVPKGAAAFGVRLLDRLVADHYEAK